jgi:hypothetical protein
MSICVRHEREEVVMSARGVKEMKEALGNYVRPEGYLEYFQSIPFIGRVHCPVKEIEAGSWQELVLDYEVGGAGLADGAWLKVTFKFYSDWALFQTDDPQGANYISAEYLARTTLPGESPATVQSLKVRFDQKGHERPYQKAVIIDIVDGYLKPGDHILIRLGDKRAGGPGTRVQTFVEKGFRFRTYIDPLGTSRFAEVPGDVVIDIVPGPPAQLLTVGPRLVKEGEPFPLRVRAEDVWGNTCWNLGGKMQVRMKNGTATLLEQEIEVPKQGWAVVKLDQLRLPQAGEVAVEAALAKAGIQSDPAFITVQKNLAFPRAFYADLHVHSKNTVGTNDTEYNFTYGRDVAGLDVLGYTANDFHITKANWDEDVKLCKAIHQDGEFVVYPGTEWCGNSCAGGDHNVVFLGEEVLFPYGQNGELVRSFEWNENMKDKEIQPGAWPIDRLYDAYIHDPENHLLMPHVGGRRCILDWHHPVLERLAEIGSAWGQFPWLYEDVLRRGYKLGVSANGDEHRGRCGGGVPGTAVFGTKGGLTGVIAPALTKRAIGQALRARHTWATTGERLVALLWAEGYLQGDELEAAGPVSLHYRLLGDAGWDEIALCDHNGPLQLRNLQEEAGYAPNRIRVRWGGARIKDRYRWAEWRGTLEYADTLVHWYKPHGLEHAEEYVRRAGPLKIAFRTDTYGDADALEMELSSLTTARFRLHVEIGSYVKVGNPLKPNPYVHLPEYTWEFTGRELMEKGVLRRELGGAELFLAAERLSDQPMPRDVEGTFSLEPVNGPHGFRPIYLRGRQVDDAKAWASALFITFLKGKKKV